MTTKAKSEPRTTHRYTFSDTVTLYTDRGLLTFNKGDAVPGWLQDEESLEQLNRWKAEGIIE